MASVEGDIQFSDTNGANRVLHSRVAGTYWLPLVLYFVATIGGAILWPRALGAILPDSSPWLVILGTAMWAGGCWFAYMQLSRQRLRRGWVQRGIVNPCRTTFMIDDEAFTVSSDMSVARIIWPGVTELIPTRKLWIFVVNGLGYCVPRRLFYDLAAERAFIAAALSRMAEGARGRSREALRFTEWEG